MRSGTMFLGAHPDAEILQWAGKSIDTISFEHAQQVIPRSRRMSMSGKFRGRYSVTDLIIRNFLADSLTFPEWLRTEKEELKLDYPWARQAAYLHSEDFRLKEKEKRANGHVKIAILGESETAYFCGLLFAKKGMRVVMVDENYDRKKTAGFCKYWGFQAFFETVYGKTLDIAKKLPQNPDFQFIFYSSAQTALYRKNSENLKDAKKGILLECREGEFGRERLRHTENAAWINTSLWKADAMLFAGKESLTEICEDSSTGAVAALFSNLTKVKSLEDREEFLEYAGRQAKYLAELSLLQDKYGMTI